MTTSPDSSSGVRPLSVASTTPAGTIIHTARGGLQFLHEVFKRIRAHRAFLGKRLHGFRMNIVHNALVAGAHKAPHHIHSHPPQPDHAQFHVCFFSLRSRA